VTAALKAAELRTMLAGMALAVAGVALVVRVPAR
jgi:hypothetical protein